MTPESRIITEGWGPDQDEPYEPYHVGPELANAVNIALLLGKPLLVSGEPGCGKTSLADRVARELRLGEPLRFNTKSSSQASDLFFHYDAVGRFGQAQLDVLTKNTPGPLHRHLHLNALGLGIARTVPRDSAAAKFGWDFDPEYKGESRHSRLSVVLIDEVDKAPRDFPNDLLNEIRDLSFCVPEAGIHEPVRVPRDPENNKLPDPKLSPIVIITSNQEAQLPDAFLRRCVYHHVAFPTPAQLSEIIQRHLRHPPGSDPALDAWVGTMEKVRSSNRLDRKPSTSEIIDFMKVLVGRGWTPRQQIGKDRVRPLLGCLFKTESDLRSGAEMIEAFVVAS